MKKLNEYQTLLKDKTPEEIMILAECNFSLGKVALSSSLGAEDQVLTDILSKNARGIRIFTLDTGRLFEETYDVIQKTKEKYNLNIEITFPDPNEIKDLVEKDWPNLFYNSVENRKKCCFVRKVKPLQKILKTVDVLITGLRSEQNQTRSKLQVIEWDEQFEIYKINHLANWSNKEVWDYIKEKSVPYNTLHNKNFPSIGCAPCTRAVKQWENIRSGRWWWEESSKKECGLHLKK